MLLPDCCVYRTCPHVIQQLAAVIPPRDRMACRSEALMKPLVPGAAVDAEEGSELAPEKNTCVSHDAIEPLGFERVKAERGQRFGDAHCGRIHSSRRVEA